MTVFLSFTFLIVISILCRHGLLKKVIMECARWSNQQRTGQSIIRSLKEKNIILDESRGSEASGELSEDSQLSQIEEVIDTFNLLERRATIASLGRMRLRLSRTLIRKLLRIENNDLKQRELPEWFKNDDYLLESEMKIRKKAARLMILYRTQNLGTGSHLSREFILMQMENFLAKK